MQEPHHRDHHHPARVALAAAATAVAALALVPTAASARFVPLPAPVAPLSPEPPLGHGAAASPETVPHPVDASTVVRVSIDGGGEPFAVTATQRLDVHQAGDYYFTIGAPVLAAEPAPGSESQPGFRTGTVVWAGFDPGRRILAAAIRLDVARVTGTLPLRVVIRGGRTTLVNATRVTASAFTADALRPQLVTYLRQLAADLRSGRTPRSGAAQVTSTPAPHRVTVVAPLRITGTIGGRRLSLVLTRRAVVPAAGRVDLVVEPVLPTSFGDFSQSGGRALLDLATRESLTVARTRQYLQYLGNPDPTGRNTTRFVYRSARRPTRVAASPAASSQAQSWRTTALVVLGIVAALAAAAYAWARS